MEFLNTFLPYFKILRLKNLILIGLTQYLIHLYLIQPFVEHPFLTPIVLAGTIAVFIFTAAGGYVINDLLDQKADMINKPNKTFIPKHISVNNAYLYYYILNTIALIIAINIDIAIGKIWMTMIGFAAIILLYTYSKYLKGTVILGNMVISLLIALTTAVIWWAEYHQLKQIPILLVTNYISNTFIGFITFSFFINQIREMVKDIEDTKGDQCQQLLTLPVRYGEKVAIKWIMFTIVVFVVLLFIWVWANQALMGYRIIMYFLLFVICPLIYITQLLYNKNKKEDLSKASSILKWVMLAGIISVILISGRIGELQ